MMTPSLPLVSDNDTTIIQTTFSVHSNWTTVSHNTSLQDGCIEVRFSEMEFIPWDNPDNIISAEAEQISETIKNNVLGFLFLIGGPSNVVNMAVFYKQGLKDRVNLCLFALSFTDLLYLTVSMLLHGEQLYLQFITTDRYGPMMTFLFNISFTSLVGLYSVSPVLSAVIAIERCYCVMRPLKIQTLMRTRTMAAIIIAVYVIVISLFSIVSFRYRIGCIHDPEAGMVLLTFVAGQTYRNHKELIDLLDGYVFGVALPGIVTVVVLASTIITAVKLREIVTWRAGTTSLLSPREVALTRMLIGNSILFIACVSPVALFHVCWLFFPEMSAEGRNHNFYVSSLSITQMLTLMNSTFNIFMYYTMGSRFRETLWVIFGRRKSRK